MSPDATMLNVTNATILNVTIAKILNVTTATSTINKLQTIDDYCNNRVSTRNIGFAVFASVVLIIGVIGNILTISVITYSRHLRTQTTYHFVVSLAFTDLCVCVLLTSFKVDLYAHNSNFCYSKAVCAANKYIDMVLMVTSITHLLIIAIDRFIAIYTPYFHEAHVTSKKAKFLIVSVWLYGIVWASLSLFPWDSNARTNFINLGMELRECASIHKSYHTVVIIVVFIIPTVIMAVLYTVIVFIAQRQAKAIENLKPSHQQKNNRLFNRDMRAVKTVAIVFSAFTICYLPNFAIQLIFYWDRQTIIDFYLADPSPGGAFDVVMTIISNILPGLNSCINPFIYFLASAHFRTALKDMVNKILNKPREGIILPDDLSLTNRSNNVITNPQCVASTNRSNNVITNPQFVASTIDLSTSTLDSNNNNNDKNKDRNINLSLTNRLNNVNTNPQYVASAIDLSMSTMDLNIHNNYNEKNSNKNTNESES